MSRGPGRWQRLFLELLDEYDHVGIIDVVDDRAYLEGREATRAEHVAARRAARRLAEDGLTRAIYLPRCTVCGQLFAGWGARCCGRVTHSLVVTRDPSAKSVYPSRIPGWISVAGADIEQRQRLEGGAA